MKFFGLYFYSKCTHIVPVDESIEGSAVLGQTCAQHAGPDGARFGAVPVACGVGPGHAVAGAQSMPEITYTHTR